MEPGSLTGRSILIVEDEALLALDIASAFEDAGASVATARTLSDALHRVTLARPCAAVLDFGQDANALCDVLRASGIPFVLHSGHGQAGDLCDGGIVVPKPAPVSALIGVVAGLLHSRAP